ANGSKTATRDAATSRGLLNRRRKEGRVIAAATNQATPTNTNVALSNSANPNRLAPATTRPRRTVGCVPVNTSNVPATMQKRWITTGPQSSLDVNKYVASVATRQVAMRPVARSNMADASLYANRIVAAATTSSGTRTVAAVAGKTVSRPR